MEQLNINSAFLDRFKPVENQITEILVNNDLSIADTQTIFNSIIHKFLNYMPVTKNTTQDCVN